MQYYRCRCGHSQAWGSMGPASCARCPKCGSDLALGPSGHSEPKPHEYVTKYDPNTGAPYEVCTLCFRKRAELESEDGQGDD